MDQDESHWLGTKLRHLANESAELPILRLLGEPLYRRLFERRSFGDNAYYGIYSSHANAMAAAARIARPSRYEEFDRAAFAGGGMYGRQGIRVSDYPLVYWLKRFFDGGCRRLFDLGGHDGVTYYSFARLLDYPADLSWTVHDVPNAMAAGAEWAREHDSQQHLSFAASQFEASGCELLISSGTLQYLEYTLPELLAALSMRPSSVLVNLVPMHPQKSFFTLQNMGRAVMPYRVQALPAFVDAMQSLGYVKQDQWHSRERHLRIPFEPDYRIDGYEGFCFTLGYA